MMAFYLSPLKILFTSRWSIKIDSIRSAGKNSLRPLLIINNKNQVRINHFLLSARCISHLFGKLGKLRQSPSRNVFSIFILFGWENCAVGVDTKINI